MFTFLFTLLKRAIFLKLLNDYLKINYPEKYGQVIISISYNAIYFFTKGQIMFISIYKNMKKMINTNETIKLILDKINVINKSSIEIEYIRNGEILKKCSQNEMNENEDLLKECDFLIFTDFIDQRGNKKIVHAKENANIDYEISENGFMLLELYVGDKVYKIDLKTYAYNYYIVGNIIDLNFILYYLNTYYSEKITIEDLNKLDKNNNCYIQALDYNVNKIKIDCLTELIEITKTGYKIM